MLEVSSQGSCHILFEMFSYIKFTLPGTQEPNLSPHFHKLHRMNRGVTQRLQGWIFFWTYFIDLRVKLINFTVSFERMQCSLEPNYIFS